MLELSFAERAAARAKAVESQLRILQRTMVDDGTAQQMAPYFSQTMRNISETGNQSALELCALPLTFRNQGRAHHHWETPFRNVRTLRAKGASRVTDNRQMLSDVAICADNEPFAGQHM